MKRNFLSAIIVILIAGCSGNGKKTLSFQEGKTLLWVTPFEDRIEYEVQTQTDSALVTDWAKDGKFNCQNDRVKFLSKRNKAATVNGGGEVFRDKENLTDTTVPLLKWWSGERREAAEKIFKTCVEFEP